VLSASHVFYLTMIPHYEAQLFDHIVYVQVRFEDINGGAVVHTLGGIQSRQLTSCRTLQIS
jgi:hypothetical protein